MIDRDVLRALIGAANGVLAGVGASAVAELQQATDRAIAHLATTNDHDCSCGAPGSPSYEGPVVDCDVHGLPSAAFAAGRREGAQDERDQARIRGDLCRWCLREPQRGERHGTTVSGCDCDPEVVCLGGDGVPLLHSSSDEDPLGLPEPVTIPARDAARRERAAYAAGRASGAEAHP